MRKRLAVINTSFLPLYVCLLIFVVAVMSFLNLNLVPIDGLLQTYNSTRRMDLGEIPYRDFVPYLGLGPVFVNFLGAKLFGSTLVGQFMFINVLHLLIGIFILFVLFEVFFKEEKKKKFLPPAVVALTGIYLVGLHFPFKSIFFILGEYTRPGNSALGLRAVILFLTIYVCLKIEKGRLVFLGYLLIGLSLTWSVDYALATYIIGSLIFRFPSVPTFSRVLKNTLANLIIGGCIGFLLISTLTKNSFNPWYSANYLTQRDFQFWYFGIDENFVYGIDTIPYLLAYAASVLMATLYLFVNFNKSNFTKFLTITASTSIGIASQINSAPSPRYLVFALLVNVFGFLGLLTSISNGGLHFKNLSLELRLVIGERILTQLSCIRDTFRKHQRFLIAALLILVFGINLVVANSFVRNNIYVQKLGGYVDPRLIESVQNGEKLGKTQDTKILSTYSGITSIIAGKTNATKTDYIIHAFTQSERNNWINALKDQNTKVVITTRSDVLRWEPWIARANWWFYSELLKQYQIKQVGTYQVYWSRKTSDSREFVDLNNFSCSINEIDSGNAYVSITPSDPNLIDIEKDLIFSIELAYESLNLSFKPLSRNRVTITAMNELTSLNPSEPSSFLNVGAPERSPAYQTYLKYNKFSSNQLLIKSSPALSSQLRVNACRIKDAHHYASLYPNLPKSSVNFDEIVRNFKR